MHKNTCLRNFICIWIVVVWAWSYMYLYGQSDIRYSFKDRFHLRLKINCYKCM